MPRYSKYAPYSVSVAPDLGEVYTPLEPMNLFLGKNKTAARSEKSHVFSVYCEHDKKIEKNEIQTISG